MLGTAYVELQRTQDAKAQFDQVLKDDPHSIQALIGMANVLQGEGQTEEVIALCKRTLALDERNAQAHTLLGEVYADLKKPAVALPSFEQAAKIQPKLTRNRLNVAAALTEMKQYGRAETLLLEIVKDYPRFPGAQYNLGLLYEEQGRLPEARAAYAAEVAAQPWASSRRASTSARSSTSSGTGPGLSTRCGRSSGSPRSMPRVTCSWRAASSWNPHRSRPCRRSRRRGCLSPRLPSSRRWAGSCSRTSSTAKDSRRRWPRRCEGPRATSPPFGERLLPDRTQER